MMVVRRVNPGSVPLDTLFTIPEQPSKDFLQIARAECPGYDPAIPYRAWLSYANRKCEGVKHPRKAFRAFCVRWREQNPPLLAAAGLDVFPAGGSISFHDNWDAIARDAGCDWDQMDLANEFRKFCKSRGIALDAPKIAKRFHTFCRTLPHR